MAGRPKRDVETQIEDLFFLADLDVQDRLLRILPRLHRLKAIQLPEGKAALDKKEPNDMRTTSSP